MKEPTCYFCTKPRKMLRGDMKVYVCVDHEPEQEVTQPSLPEVVNLASTARAIGLQPTVRDNLFYTPVDKNVWNEVEGAWETVPAARYFWVAFSGHVHWDKDREQAEHRMRGEGFV